MTQIPIKELIPHEELMASGHLACPGCGGSLAMRLVLKTLGPKTIVSLPACCWTIVAGPYPQSSLGVPLFHTAFETAASAASAAFSANCSCAPRADSMSSIVPSSDTPMLREDARTWNGAARVIRSSSGAPRSEADTG